MQSTRPSIANSPGPLRKAVVRVARDRTLAPDWLNTAPASEREAGLPSGSATRVTWRDYAALRDVFVSRYDLILFKLYVAIDSERISSHFTRP